MNEEIKTKQLHVKHKRLCERLSMFAKIDKARLNQEMIQISSQSFSVGNTKADAEYEMGIAEKNAEITEARTDKKIRAKFSGKRKPSEQQIKTMVLRHPDVQKAREAFLEAKWKHGVCWAAVNAIAQKGNQLTNLAYNYRKELDRGVGSKVREGKLKEKGKQFMNERTEENG